VLDLGAAELRLQRLHPDEHDERAVHAQRLRGGRHRRADHVRHATRRRVARRPSGLEQQLRGRRDKCVLFHCGNWAKSFLPDITIANAPILGSTLGVENTYGAFDGRTPAGPLTFGRLTTDDNRGQIRAYVGEGELTNDELEDLRQPRGGHVPRLQRLCDTSARKVSSITWS
jgi:L-fucose isomerase-like protein